MHADPNGTRYQYESDICRYRMLAKLFQSQLWITRRKNRSEVACLVRMIIIGVRYNKDQESSLKGPGIRQFSSRPSLIQSIQTNLRSYAYCSAVRLNQTSVAMRTWVCLW